MGSTGSKRERSVEKELKGLNTNLVNFAMYLNPQEKELKSDKFEALFLEYQTRVKFLEDEISKLQKEGGTVVTQAVETSSNELRHNVENLTENIRRRKRGSKKRSHDALECKMGNLCSQVESLSAKIDELRRSGIGNQPTVRAVFNLPHNIDNQVGNT